MTNKIKTEDLNALAEKNKGATNEDGELSNIFLQSTTGDTLTNLFNLADESRKYFIINPNNMDVKLRILSAEELIYADELYAKYIGEMLDNKFVTDDHRNLCRLVYHSAIVICMSACKEPVIRGTSLQEISKQSQIEFPEIKNAPFPVISFLINLIDSENRKFNPEFEDLDEEEVKVFVEQIKKQKIQLWDLNFQTCLSLLKSLIVDEKEV